MNSKPAKIALLVATLLPVAYMIFFMWFVLQGMSAPSGVDPFDHSSFMKLFMIHLGIMAWSLGLLIFYVVNLFKNQHVPESQKALWAVVLFFGAQIAMVIYWALHIWPQRDPRAVT